MIGAQILAGEVAFWAFVLAGLVARYLLRRPRLGLALLLTAPAVDLALVAATVVDLRAGATADFFHGLAAIYIGVSVAFGHRMIGRTDARFVHRFAGGPPPQRPPNHGPEHARRKRHGWYQHPLAWCIGSAILFGMVVLVGDPDRTESLSARAGIWAPTSRPPRPGWRSAGTPSSGGRGSWSVASSSAPRPGKPEETGRAETVHAHRSRDGAARSVLASQYSSSEE